MTSRLWYSYKWFRNNPNYLDKYTYYYVNHYWAQSDLFPSQSQISIFNPILPSFHPNNCESCRNTTLMLTPPFPLGVVVIYGWPSSKCMQYIGNVIYILGINPLDISTAYATERAMKVNGVKRRSSQSTLRSSLHIFHTSTIFNQIIPVVHVSFFLRKSTFFTPLCCFHSRIDKFWYP